MSSGTDFYHNGELKGTTPAMTLAKFMKTGRMEPGQYIKVVGAAPFWVGDCTPFHEPSENDGGFGWGNKYNTDLLISEVHSFSV